MVERRVCFAIQSIISFGRDTVDSFLDDVIVFIFWTFQTLIGFVCIVLTFDRHLYYNTTLTF